MSLPRIFDMVMNKLSMFVQRAQAIPAGCLVKNILFDMTTLWKRIWGRECKRRLYFSKIFLRTYREALWAQRHPTWNTFQVNSTNAKVSAITLRNAFYWGDTYRVEIPRWRQHNIKLRPPNQHADNIGMTGARHHCLIKAIVSCIVVGG